MPARDLIATPIVSARSGTWVCGGVRTLQDRNRAGTVRCWGITFAVVLAAHIMMIAGHDNPWCVPPVIR